jgi:RNA-directed DNA polymerase
MANPQAKVRAHTVERDGYDRLGLIHHVVRTRPTERLTSLVHLFNVPNLRRAFQQLDGTRAAGIDRVTKEQYRKDLENNLEALVRRLREGRYRPMPSRVVQIPKPQGGTRPIAIGCLEDKVVQTLMARLLEVIFEPLFSPRSYGFRPGKSAHQALGRLHETIMQSTSDRKSTGVVVEMDIEKFFDSMNQTQLMRMVETRICDPNLLRLLRTLLAADVLQEGVVIATQRGTPQGSPVSPVLANIYLHFLLDEWFHKNYATVGRMVRYADDAVFVFKDLAAANSFREALMARLEEGELKLNLDKSTIVPFSRQSPKGTVSFLGFEFFWGRTKSQRIRLKTKTLAKRFSKAVNDFTSWIKAQRNRAKLDALWAVAKAKLTGHFLYYGVRSNAAKLDHFFRLCVGALFKWTNRRSQKRSFTWEKFAKRLRAKPLFPAYLEKDLRDISSQHNADKHKLKSRMREIRKSGSVRSAGLKPVFT